MSALLLNRAKETVSTTGTGTMTLTGAVTPYQSWATAQLGSSTTRKYSYLIEDGINWEIGEGVYNEGASTLTRGLIASSTGSLLNLSGTATVACSQKATDVAQVIEKKVFVGGETSFAFSDISQDFTTLELEIYGRLQVVAAGTNLPITVNGLTTAIYDLQRQYAQTTTNTADVLLGQTSLLNANSFPGTSFPAGQAAGVKLVFPGYNSTAFHKVFTSEGFKWPNSTTTFNNFVMKVSGGIRTTAAITSMEVAAIPSSGQWVAGSYAILRGIP